MQHGANETTQVYIPHAGHKHFTRNGNPAALFEETATLLGLQSVQPFSLFRVTYLAVGVGTSSLTLGDSLILADGSGNKLAAPTVTAGSITVLGTTPTVPEPSTFALLSTGGLLIVSAVRRRFA